MSDPVARYVSRYGRGANDSTNAADAGDPVAAYLQRYSPPDDRSILERAASAIGQAGRGLAHVALNDVVGILRPTEEEVAEYERGDYNPATEGFAAKLGINIHNPTAGQREMILPEGERGQTRGELLQHGAAAAALLAAAPAEASIAKGLAARGVGKLASHAAASGVVNAAAGAALSPEDRLKGAEYGGAAGVLLPFAPAVLRSRAGRGVIGAALGALTGDDTGERVKRGAVGGAAAAFAPEAAGAILRRAARALDFTGGLDDAIAAGVREGADPAFDAQAILAANAGRAARRQSLGELLAGMEELAGPRAAVAQEAPSTTSQLLRAARAEQLAAAEMANRSLELPARKRPEVRPIRDLLREFQEERAAGATREAERLEAARQASEMPRAASSEAESTLPLPGNISASHSGLPESTQVPDASSHTSTTGLPDASSRTDRTTVGPSSISVGREKKSLIVGSGEIPSPGKIQEPPPAGHAGTTMLSSIAGSGAGGLAGATKGDTPEERARNAALGAAAGFAGGAAIAEGMARALRVSASENAVRAAVRGVPTRQEVRELLEQVRANPRKPVHYVVRDESGKIVGSGSDLAEFFADVGRGSGRGGSAPGGVRSGAIGVQPEGGAGSPFQPNTPRARIPYEPGSRRTPPPVSNAELAAGTPPLSVPAELDPEDYFNFSRVLLDPGGEKRLREEVALVARAQGLDPKKRVGWEETKRIAKELGLSAEDIVARGETQRLSGAEMLAIRNIVKDNVDALERISQQLGTDGKLTEAEKEMLARQASALERQNDVLLGRFVKARSQTGRDLNSLKILAEGSLDPTTWILRAKRMLGNQPFTEEMRTEIMRLINLGDRSGLAAYVAKLRKPRAHEKLITLWKAGLLTGPTTHIANALGNTTMAALEMAKDVPAAALDALAGAVTGQRTKDLSVRAAIRASREGAAKGLQEAREIMAGRVMGEGLGKYDLSREIDFDNAFLDKYTKLVFRSLTASDRIFKQAALARSIAEQARVLAKAQKFTGAALETEIERLTKFPTDEMALRAIEDAEIATFQNRGILGNVAVAARRAAAKHAAADVVANVVMPFTMTPANVASRMVEYSPFGALGTVGDVVKLFAKAMPEGARYNLQRKVVERLGRSAVGSLPILAGYLLAKAGKMTGGYPSDQRTRDQWAFEGKQENSVLIDGKWRSLERISPLGNLVVYGAQLFNAFSDDEKSLSEKLGSSTMAMAKTVADQSFVSGLYGAMGAIRDPEREGGSYLRRTAGSVVPNIVNRAARALDPLSRERETLADEFKYRIPGLSKSLPARIDQFGRETQNPSGFAAIFDPTAARNDEAEHDPLVAEIQRVDAHVGKLGRHRRESDLSYRKRQRIYGIVLERRLRDLIRSDSYRQARHVAEVLVARDWRFSKQDPVQLAADLQRGLIEDAVTDTRRKLTAELRGR